MRGASCQKRKLRRETKNRCEGLEGNAREEYRDSSDVSARLEDKAIELIGVRGEQKGTNGCQGGVAGVLLLG